MKTMNKPKCEVRLTADEIELLKECLQERNNILQRNLHNTITINVAMENDKKNSFDGDYKKWAGDRLAKQYEEQAMIAHIETSLNNAKEERVSIVRCDYDLCYISKAPKIADKWSAKSAVVPSNTPVELDGTEISNGEITVRFEACINRPGYEILIERR